MSAPKPTAVELDVLQALWPLGPVSARALYDDMVKTRPDLSYAMTLRMLQIMHGKGMLLRDESQRPHLYRPAQAQESLQSNLIRDLAQRAFAGSAKSLVIAALRSNMSKAERDEIEQLLKETGG
jgi:predicted transcriptional regulator